MTFAVFTGKIELQGTYEECEKYIEKHYPTWGYFGALEPMPLADAQEFLACCGEPVLFDEELPF